MTPRRCPHCHKLMVRPDPDHTLYFYRDGEPDRHRACFTSDSRARNGGRRAAEVVADELAEYMAALQEEIMQ